MNTKKMQKGFTLIELMIVIAIIAILAAIAIPQYETYITKSQFAEAPSIAGGFETDVQLYWTQAGGCPTLGTTPGFPTAAASYAGKYVASADVSTGTGTGATCDIKVTFKPGTVSKPLQTHSVTFTGTQSGGNFNWKCSSADIDAKYLPQACR